MYDGSVGQGHAGQDDENLASLISTDLTELMSKSALESWLDEAPTTPLVQNSIQASCARVSFTTRSFERKPKLHVLLDPSNSNGLSVLYAFSSEVSPNSRLLVCIDLFVENVTPDQLANISIKSEEASTSEHGMETSEGSARYASSVKKTNWTITYIARCL
jgi:AP-3 complex subunit beta